MDVTTGGSPRVWEARIIGLRLRFNILGEETMPRLSKTARRRLQKKKARAKARAAAGAAGDGGAAGRLTKNPNALPPMRESKEDNVQIEYVSEVFAPDDSVALTFAGVFGKFSKAEDLMAADVWKEAEGTDNDAMGEG